MRDLMVRGSRVKPSGLDPIMCVSWVWLYRNKETEQRFVMSNLDLGGKDLARVGKRRWRNEAFFKTVQGRFGLERFAQHSKQGVLRWWCLSGSWPDWGDLARTVRVLVRPEVRRHALQLELNALDAFQHALLESST